MDELILKYLRGEFTLEERHKFEQLLDDDKSLKSEIKKLNHYWENSQIDLSKEQAEVLGMIRIRTGLNKRSTKNNWKQYLRYAAIFVAATFISFLAYNIFDIPDTTEVSYIERETSSGQKLTLKLPDGSYVKLNAESKLIVPEVFSEDIRELELIGEAFFDITPDPSRPFIIKVRGMNVKVLGTSFNIRSYTDEVDQTVSVRTGKVSVKNTSTGSEVDLIPNESAILVSEKGRLIKRKVENQDLTFGWIDQKIVFETESIEKVFKTLSQWYGVKVKIESNRKFPKSKLYTAHHGNPSLEEVLKNLAYVYDFKYDIKDEVVTIK